MFFQISPVIHKKPKPAPQKKPEDEEAKIEILSLAPFTANPKIVFDNVIVGTIQTRKLLIRNPTGHDVNLFVKKPIPEEMNLALSWNDTKIEKGSEVLLEMVWGPTGEEACFHSFILSDGKRINRDIGITFKSIIPKRVKASGTKFKTKPNPVKLSLSRKPISPTKNLKPQRKSPMKHPSPKKTQYYTPPQKYVQQQRVEYKVQKEVVGYRVSNTQQVYNFQASVWETENNHLKNKFTCKENKENMSPVQQPFLNNMSGSFRSPTNATFSMENHKTDERRDTYILNSIPDRRDTYFLKTDKLEKIIESTNTTFELRHKFIEASESFFIKSREASPHFRDSLESPVSNLPLRERNDENSLTPSLESLLNNRNAVKKERLSPNFQSTLKAPHFSFSPAISPYTNASPNVFVPTICSTSSKPSSTNNSYENTAKSAMELFAQTTIQLNGSNETYTKGNTSSDTYVKDNSSFETYVKENLSGGTYVKDNSVGDVGYLDVSPLSSRTQRAPSPVFLKPKSFEFSPLPESSRHFIEPRLGQNLSSIAEESSVFNDSHFRTGSKRKSTSFSGQPTKRDRPSLEHKKEWSKSGGAAVRVATKSSGLNLKQFTKPNHQEQTQALSSITETMSKSVIIKNPFLYANIMDPFMTYQVYSDEEWLDQQENNFKKWLNALLTPPDELSTKNEVDVARVWQECTKKEVSEAPTRETMSLNYHTNKKLNYLRSQAQHLFRSKDMGMILQKVCIVVESGKLSIRDDKDIHLNLKLKSDITRLILGYNPLWLRIGLETIYNEIIPLKSNSDSHGLASFILERFLKDPHLIKKYKTIYAPKYSVDLKKFMLKKFLILVYFLDRAKNEKLIQHDPCLFCKNAVEKESKLVLTHFSRETLSAVGDITKYLKCLGYVVTHVQSYIHEFDYAVKNLGVDLRDGVRLTKVMEIIQMRNDLTTKLRVPAISRLQKVHNMQLVFKSLQESGYEIMYEIVAKDIVDGHKEKTLSFLWQIIYKFEAPLMVKNATTIQTWFRSLPVQLKRRKLRRIREKRENAAKKIQAWYRRQKMSQIYLALAEFARHYVEEQRRILACIKIQSFLRMVICRRRFVSQYKAITKLQAYAKGWLIRNNYKQRIDAAVVIQKTFRAFICRKRFLEIRRVVITVQRKYKATKQMKEVKCSYERLRRATIIIQRRYRAKLAMTVCRKQFISFKKAAIKIQSFYRMYIQHRRFLRLKTAAKVIQCRYRAQKTMQSTKAYYLRLKMTTIFVQRRFRANTQMLQYKNSFNSLRNSVIRIQSFYRMHYLRKLFINLRSATLVIQTRYRAQLAMRIERKKYLCLKNVVLFIQRRFRANTEMKSTRQHFIRLKTAATKIQSYYRMYVLRKRFLELRNAAKVIQHRYKAQKAMINQKSYFVVLRESTITIQRIFRANKVAKKTRQEFILVRETTIIIQTHFRSFIARKRFLKLKDAAITVQRRYLAQKAMAKQRDQYQKLRNATLVLQRRWRARQMCVEQKTRYEELRRATTNIQQRFRANKLMLRERQSYLEIKSATIKIQTYYRSVLTMRSCRQQYIFVKKSVLIIEQRYIEIKLMRDAQAKFETLRNATKVIQQYFRALVQMRTCRRSFLELKSTTVAIQRRYRANKLMQKEEASYKKLKSTTVFIQNIVRANKVARFQRSRFLIQKNAAIKIQRWYRATVEMRKCRNYYSSLKLAVASIETRYQAKKLMQREKTSYECLKKATLVIQVQFKSILERRKCRKRYLELKNATIVIQTRFRAKVVARIELQRYQRLKTITLFIQRQYRAKKSMQKCKSEFVALKKATLCIQQRYRAQRQMIECRRTYLRLQSACLLIQRRYRAKKLMVLHLQEFRMLKKSVIVIQQRFRATILAKNERSQYVQMRQSVLVIQRRFRAQILMNTQSRQFIKLRETTVMVQRKYRATVMMKKQRTEFVELKKAAIVIQTRYRAITAMRIERTRFEKLRRAIFVIQRKLRATILAKTQRQWYVKFKRSVTIIQLYYKSYLMMTRQRQQYLAIRSAAVHIQRFARGYLVRKEYAPLLTPEAVESRKVLKIQNAAATKIQANWRGFSLRRSNIPVMVALRKKVEHRVAEPRASFQARTLAQRCEAAMLCMTAENSSLVMIINALEDLDFVTRHCRDLCTRLSEILPFQLYIIITSAARSLPEMKAVTVATLILINFCKYPRTRKNSWNSEYMDGVFNVLLHCCDKDSLLFPTLCTLLWLFGQEDEWKKTILALPNIDQRVIKISNLVHRKQAMVMKSKKVTNISVFGPVGSTKLPTRKANWGLDYDRPNTFTNAVFALTSLMRVLDVT